MSFTITDAPSSINFDQEFEVLVNLENASHNINYYLQVALTSPESTAYFGYTQKEDGTWYKYNETYDLFYKITTSQEGSWSGKLKGKPDIEDTNFKGTGSYLLKIGRFTSTGKSHYWSDNSLTINIAGPTPTSTPTLTPTMTPSPTPTPIPTSTSTPTSSPSPKPTSTPTFTPTSQPTVTLTPTPTTTSIIKESTNSASIAGVAIETDKEATPYALLTNKKKSFNLLLIAPVVLSILFIAASIFLFYHNPYESRNQK